MKHLKEITLTILFFSICHIASAQINVSFSGGVTVGNDTTSNPVEGTIRYADGILESYNGSMWIPLTTPQTSLDCNFPLPVPTMLNYQVMTGSQGVVSRPQYGLSVAINNNIAFVGEPHETSPGDEDGRVYMLRYDGANWSEAAIFQAQNFHPPGWSNSKFGNSIALDDNTLVVGAMDHALNDTDAQYNKIGAVFIFDIDTSTNSITPVDTLWAPDPATGSHDFGFYVEISGDRIVVHDGGLRVYAYKRTNGVWGNGAAILHPFGSTENGFGRRVSLNGKDLLVNISTEDVNGINNVGSVYYFRNSFGNIWTFQDTLNMPDPKEFGSFGQSVSIYNDYAAIGAPGGGANGEGKIYIFRRNGTTWELQQELSGTPYAYLGHRVVMKGNYIVSTKIGVDGNNGKTDVGGANIYKFDSGQWSLSGSSTYNLGNTDDFMGNSDVDTDMINFVMSTHLPNVNGIHAKGKILFSSIDPN